MIEAAEFYETNGAYEAYIDYITIKMHFSNPDYDYFKFHGQANATVHSFRKRNDKKLFFDLSKKSMPHERILAHVLANFECSVRDIVDGDLTYYEWKRKQDAFTRTFKNDLSQFASLRDAVTVEDGGYPEMLSAYISGDISLETITAMDMACEVFNFWKTRIDDNRLFPTTMFKVRKYRPFLNLNKDRLKSIIATFS